MNKTIRLCLYPTYYGKDNLVNAFKTKNIAFELEIRTDSSVQV